ncbi:CGNR zinc finger domain-containing protein [Bradyrhizobium ganzhouense]|uniref:CGNR zinc finger domain-containing protein n=1 Tax=Bradyrhizobium ganzhouense TaxID=1179767 RepID=UPI003CF1D8B6
MPTRALECLASLSERDTAATKAAMREALSLRADIWKIVDALRKRLHPDLSPINQILAAAPSQPPILKSTKDYVHDFRGKSLREPLWPVLWSLTSLITSVDATRIGCCQAEGCGWFYVDESPNRTRLWCSSEVCGNRERARRAYAKRTKKGPTRR